MQHTQLFPNISPLTYGCASVGKQIDQFMPNVSLIRSVMETGIWFHASQEYSGGGAFMVLRSAFDEARHQRPKVILKIRCDHSSVLAFDIEDALRRLNLDKIDVVQLCRAVHDSRPIVDDFISKGEMFRLCTQFKKEGKVGEFIFEIFSSFSQDALKAVKHDLFPAYIYYYNPGERQVSSELHQKLEASQKPILSLRTMCGGTLDPKRTAELKLKNPGHPMIPRYELLVPLFESSGCSSWAEFSFSFLKSRASFVTSVAGTSKKTNFTQLLEASRKAKPLETSLQKQIDQLHATWG